MSAADPTPYGVSQAQSPPARPPAGMPLACAVVLMRPLRSSSVKVDCQTVRKQTTWRARPADTASMAAITEPDGPNVSWPPLYQVGWKPIASATSGIPPSPMPGTVPMPG